MKKKALIFGVTGQDGAYLSKFLLKKNYIVHGVKRRSSSLNTSRIDDIYEDWNKKDKKFILHYGDITDSNSVTNIILKVLPDEIYNLAAQSHVAVSFDLPEYTANTDALGSLRILEAIKNIKHKKKIKYYQAGTSELFGISKTKFQNEKTNFYPRSPYAAAKLYAHWITINYRESYNIFASNGILFNHESPVRGETFVTKKVVDALCNIKFGFQKKLFIGNLNAKRDWGHAKDYVRAMWLILQHKKPDDFVISTGKQYSIRQLINLAAKKIDLNIKWINKNQGLKEYAVDRTGNKIIEVSKNYFRPAEVETLLGDYKKAKKNLGWKPSISFDELIAEMVQDKLSKIKKNENKKN
jgi:GDPmannose 4,6-dehydratase